MSFTGNIKNEISNIEYSDSEKMAELSAILNIGIKLYEDKFEIYTENISVARRIYKLIKEIYHIEINMDIFLFGVKLQTLNLAAPVI